MLKPHDAGFIWLYFLLVGPVMRRRALHTLTFTAALALIAAAWITFPSPHWIQELHKNHVLVAAPGSTSDPSLSGTSSSGVANPLINLQAVFVILSENSSIYNAASFLLTAPLILVWVWAVRRIPASPSSHLLALSSIAPLALLPVYHRSYDGTLLLLTIPGCALLWSVPGVRRWIAILLTLLGLLSVGDIPLALLLGSTQRFIVASPTIGKKLLIIITSRPTPLILLAMGCFYLWCYLRLMVNHRISEKRDITSDPVAPLTTR